MDGDKSVTATFTLDTHTLTLGAGGSGTGTLGGGGTYNHGTMVAVSAVADSGSTFDGLERR